MIYIQSNRKLNSLAFTLHVSSGTAYSIIRETNKYLPRQMPYQAIKESADALPISFRKPLFIAAQLVKTFQLVPNKLPQPYEVILAETESVANLRYYFALVKGTQYYQEAVNKISAEAKVILKREPDSIYDPNATMICAENGELIGYVDRHLARLIAAQLDELGGTIPGTVTKRFLNSYPKNTLGVEIYFALPRPTDNPKKDENLCDS